MAATIIINRHTGAGTANGGTTFTNITAGSTRLKQADDGVADANNPVPAVTTSYSFWASFRLQCTVAPSNLINNLKWYSDGSAAGTGLTYSGADASTGGNAGYVQATSAIQLTTGNHSGLDTTPVDVSTLTSGSPRNLGGSTSGTGHFGDLFVAQLAATSSASPGTVAARTWSFQYDET